MRFFAGLSEFFRRFFYLAKPFIPKEHFWASIHPKPFGYRTPPAVCLFCNYHILSHTKFEHHEKAPFEF
jgi:hypothetical protein